MSLHPDRPEGALHGDRLGQLHAAGETVAGRGVGLPQAPGRYGPVGVSCVAFVSVHGVGMGGGRGWGGCEDGAVGFCGGLFGAVGGGDGVLSEGGGAGVAFGLVRV